MQPYRCKREPNSQTARPLIKNKEIAGGAVSEASDTLRRARRPGRADRTSARARHETGCRIRAVRAADVSNEGTARSAAWRLPGAGIVKGLASPLIRTPAAERLKLPAAWRAEPAQSPACAAGQLTAGGTRSAPRLRSRPTRLAGGTRSAPACAAGQLPAGGTRSAPRLRSRPTRQAGRNPPPPAPGPAPLTSPSAD